MSDFNNNKNYKTRTFTYPGTKTLWLTFAAYALIIAEAFSVLFKRKHNPEEEANLNH